MLKLTVLTRAEKFSVPPVHYSGVNAQGEALMKLGISTVKLLKRVSINMDQLKYAENLGFDTAWAGEVAD